MEIYRPEVVSANTLKASNDRLTELRGKEGVQIIESIEGQVQELIISRHPEWSIKKYPEKYEQFLEDYLQGRSLNDIGNWVYYPWLNQLIHVLDEQEFVEVRTNRNKYKITPEEQDKLQNKTIGIIGLSVGSSIALTIAMERTCGELRLADYDTIELSNLNRINAGLPHLGENKAIYAARKIAELDPYLKVIVYDEGLTDATMNAFFNEPTPIDLLIEECDSLDVKVQVREYAKTLAIPVLMETNDRAMLDVERFDQDPNRAIFHGLARGLDPVKLKTLKTSEDKVPYMLDMISIDQTTSRLRASLLEIEKSICSWPQTASAVSFGAGITVSTARNVLLGHPVQSGRYYNDFDQIGIEKQNDTIKPVGAEHFDYKSFFKNFFPSDLTTRTELAQSIKNQLVDDILVAPSAANTQPWKYYYEAGNLWQFHDVLRGMSYWDQDHMGAGISLGCAIANLELSAAELGLAMNLTLYENNLGKSDQPIFHARLTPGQPAKQELYQYLYSRHTNRLNLASEPIDQSTLQPLQNVFDGSPFELHILPPSSLKDEMSDVLGEFERLRLLSPAGHSDFLREVRWTADEAKELKDGIDLATINLTESEKAAMRILKDETVIEELNNWEEGSGLKELVTKGIDLSDTLMFISAKGLNNRLKIESGKYFQYLWLELTKLDLAVHPLTSIAILGNLIYADVDIQPKETNVIKGLNQRTNKALNLKDDSHIYMAMRISKIVEPEVKSYRLNKDEVYFEK